MGERILRIGARSSALAQIQASLVRDAIVGLTDQAVEVTAITTADSPRALPGGMKGAFVVEIQQALIRGEIDCAVHSAKDLPVATPAEIALAAIGPREDPRDALVTRPGVTWESLPAGANIGTSSLRRIAQLRALGRGFAPTPLRGNVDTRIRRLDDGDVDALVVALAGVRRLGREDRVTHVFSPDVMLPPPGQGSLAIECRAGDESLRGLLGQIEDDMARRAYECERALMVALGGDCALPLGALATIVEDQFFLRAMVATLDGARVLRDEERGADPVSVAHALAQRMREGGAAEIIAAARESA